MEKSENLHMSEKPKKLRNRKSKNGIIVKPENRKIEKKDENLGNREIEVEKLKKNQRNRKIENFGNRNVKNQKPEKQKI